MRLLLDTNALIWWLQDDRKLGPKARSLISSGSNQVMTSIVSLWEITIKWRVGKLAEPGSVFAALMEEQGIALLNLKAEHLAALENLAFHHRDPYDHIIIAQAKVERMPIITSDAQMHAYGVPCIGVD